MILSVDSETGQLAGVVIGYADNFHAMTPEVVNETQRRYYFGSLHPNQKKIVDEYVGFRDCLERHGVRVFQPSPVANVPDQLSPRDIGFVVGGTLVLANVIKSSRKDEWKGLEDILRQLSPDRIVRPPAGAYVEGGDIIVDRGCIFVGMGQRTTLAGASFLQQRFPEYDVVPIELRKLDEGEDVVHLDCVFVPVGEQSALIYRPGFRSLPPQISDRYELIDVTREEQNRLATNVLSISPKKVISMPEVGRVNQELRRRGIEVLEVDFCETIKTGGSFHCGSMPLDRGRSGNEQSGADEPQHQCGSTLEQPDGNGEDRRNP